MSVEFSSTLENFAKTKMTLRPNLLLAHAFESGQQFLI